MNQQSYRKLISGTNGGLGASFLHLVLGGAAQVYSIVIRLRNFLYSKGWLKIHRVNAAVISVGNITVGGTGKTPLVIWLYKQIIKDSTPQAENCRCAILSRGYKSTKNLKLKTRSYRDEPAILIKSCPEAKLIINPDRLAGACEAVNKFGAKILIMDDGFQHRRLGRDIDIVTIDATEPFGFGRMLPAGLLRESPAGLSRADAVVLTRCDQSSEAELNKLEEKLKLINPDMIIARSIHSPICAKSLGRKEIKIEELKDKKIFAFCGIGNPDAFLNTIRQLGVNPVGSKIYNDHYHYTNDCLADIYEEALYLKADLILSTEKDWTKTALAASAKMNIPLAYLAIELKFTAGEDKLRGLIEDTLAGKIL